MNPDAKAQGLVAPPFLNRFICEVPRYGEDDNLNTSTLGVQQTGSGPEYDIGRRGKKRSNRI